MNRKVRIAKTMSDMQCFLEETIANSNFELQKIQFSEQRAWSVKEGVLSHVSGGFFHVTGIESRITGEQHLVLFQPQSGLTGLALYKDSREIYLLLQARIEPGNCNFGQYGPTIQATPGNYLQMHGGKKTEYIELFWSYTSIANSLGNNTQLDLGKRYFHKAKVHSYVELAEPIDTTENMIWVPLSVVVQTLSDDNFLNADLRSLISVFDWDRFVNADIDIKQKRRKSESDYAVCPENGLGNDEWKLIGLDQLKGWKLHDNGIIDVSNSGIWIEMYDVSCSKREARQWSQPLFCCGNRGLVVLAIRKVNNHYEFLVSIQSEFGISAEKTVLPSYVFYAGENHENKSSLFKDGTVMAKMILSDEGGRFYKNENIYQVILITNDFAIEPHQKWVSVDAFKGIVTSSCRASIQLRCITSLVFDVINPDTWASVCKPPLKSLHR